MKNIKVLTIIILLVLGACRLFASDYSVSFSTARVDTLDIFPGDTSSFTANTSGGWSILSSYLNQDTPDSVELEMILLLNQTKGKMGGKTEQYIGTINNKKFQPKQSQKSVYTLLPGNVWYIVVKQDGKCFLAQTMGSGVKASTLAGRPDIIPIKVRFKNK